MATTTVHPKNKLNNLTGSEWLYRTKSVLITNFGSIYGHELRKKHGANKPPQLMAWLIEMFTKPGARVLDPFAGVGGTLLGAEMTGRTGFGIEINEEWIEIYRRVCEQEHLPMHSIWQGSCLEVMSRWLELSEHFAPFDYIVMDPPYNIHLEQTMSGKAGEKYVDEHANRGSIYNMRSEEEADFANLDSYAAYLDAMEQMFRLCYQLLAPGKYLSFMIRNAYQHGEYVDTHVDVGNRAKRAGFKKAGETIWIPSGCKLRPYGYPNAFVPNEVHTHIVHMRKGKVAKS